MRKTSENGVACTRPTRQGGAAAPAIRTYRQIAEILTAREGLRITPARVRQICQEAELKILAACVEGPFQQQITAMFADGGRVLNGAADVAEQLRVARQTVALALLADSAISGGTRPGFGVKPHDEESQHNSTEAVEMGSYSKVQGLRLESQS